MGLSQGMRVGSCEILAPLGAGGMGEVWRGRDTRLGRDVAVKALPDAFAHDADRLARVEREAQVLAALNHPNLAIIHELNEVAGSKYLILELVEGETLAERIARGPVPITNALDIALQMARAVQAAHDKGIVHRDLKPANVKITPEGRVKVLDFGLAKIDEPAGPSGNLSFSPTFSAGQTEAGMILGTAAYMSPEQARGKEVDRRTDVWAFGCVLYEMLTGRQPFPNGETLSDTLAGILVREPDWQALPEATPPKIRALLERCLRKDERRRIRDMGDARIAIEEARSESEASAAAAAVPRASRRREVVFGALALVFLLVAAGLAARLFLQTAPQTPAVRLDLPTPVGMPNSFYLSPDGKKLAFVTSPAAPGRIWVRSLDSAAAEPLPSTEGIVAPALFYFGGNLGQNNALFWSADSQYIGFIAEGQLKKVAAAGGPAQVLATLPPAGNYFGTWSQNGVILIASDAIAGGPLLRVPAAGGEPGPATELDKTRNEQSHRFPHFLPDGRHYLYLATGSDARDRVVYVGTLDSAERHPLEGIAAEVKYSSGHLVFVRDGALMAQPFNLDRLALAGDAFPVADRFAPAGALTWSFTASTNGILAYRAAVAGAGGVASHELVWRARQGTRLTVAGAEAEYQGPELSPDGKFVAFARGSPADIWTLDIEKNVSSKWTTDAAADLNPRWSPDGKSLAFDSARDGVANLYQRAVGVSGADTLVFKSEGAKSLSDWSRDGKYLAYVEGNDVWALPLTAKPGDPTAGEPKPIQVTKTSFMESVPRISPDSRWIAYVSNKSGQNEVYVQSFPEPGIEQQVSTGAIGSGPTLAQPRWSRDGKELFYFVPNPGRIMAVSIKPAGTSLNAAAQVELFRHPGFPGFASLFNVTSDGRFLFQLAPSAAASTNPGAGNPQNFAAQAPITVIINFAGHRARER
ncbi:MAG: protein kinase domain-containing protein [Acidobacteriota bacterium]